MFSTKFIAAILAALLSTSACVTRSHTSDADLEEADSSASLNEEHALRVNLTTNMATYYKNGQPIRAWKVASARRDGRSATPTGKFRAHELTICAPWTSTRNNLSTGGCAENNPLGKRALWFNAGRQYGMHGVDSSHISSVTGSSAESRRQSSGCVRNHPDDIAWLTAQVAPLYGTTADQLANDVAAKRTRTYRPRSKGLPIIVGNFNTPDGPTNGSACTEENADAALASDDKNSPVALYDEGGSEKAKVAAWSPTCTTGYISPNNVAKVFMPVEPEGFAFVPRATVRKCNVSKLRSCISGGGGRGPCAARECKEAL